MAEDRAPRVAVAQLGARRHYAVPRILHAAGMLELFFTDSYSGDKPLLRRLVAGLDRVRSTDAARRWLSRQADDLPPERVVSFELAGWRFAVARRARRHGRSTAPLPVAARALNRGAIRHGLGAADTVYAYNGAALELFQHAKRAGLRCVLDQTQGARRELRRLMLAEHTRWPGWQSSMYAPGEEDERTLREEAEWSLADSILCPSEFVRESIAAVGGPVEKCVLLPYGTDQARFPPRQVRRPPEGRPLRVLFAGDVGLRKGVPYLLEALRLLGPQVVEGRLVGQVVLDTAKLERYRDVATFVGAVPRTEMADHYVWADVFVFPSICEGSAQVLFEALASCLPVICTSSSGPPPAASGLHIVPQGDVDAVVEAMRWIADHYASSGPTPETGHQLGLDAYARRLGTALADVRDHERRLEGPPAPSDEAEGALPS